MINATVPNLRVKVVLLEIYCLKYCKTHSYLLTASLSRCLTVSLLQFLSFKFEFFMLLAEKLGFTFTLGITTY